MGNVIHWEKNNVNNFCTILIQRDNKTVEKCQDQHLSRKTPPNQRMTQQNSCNKRWGVRLGKEWREVASTNTETIHEYSTILLEFNFVSASSIIYLEKCNSESVS